jgi:hypothetical protein
MKEVLTETLRAILKDEVALLLEQGFELGAMPEHLDSADFVTLEHLEAELDALPEPLALSTKEPLSWAIPSGSYSHWIPSEEELQDRIAGAWFGRIAGCLLGKPVEIWPVFLSHIPLHRYLKATNQYPLAGYVRSEPEIAQAIFGEPLNCPKSWAQDISFAESDDDLRYAYMGVDILDQVGPEFETKDVSAWWVTNLTPEMTFTAEQAVMANLYRLSPHAGDQKNWSAGTWDFVRRYRNPWREYIGAAIRADGWAYAAAGDPVQAGTYAQRDARLSHERNGEYSEIFFAAWISGAFRWPLDEALEQALRTIPAESRLSQAIQRTQAICAEHRDFEPVCELLHSEFDRYHAVHAINNAAACVAAVLLSDGDYEKGITQAVMFGWDTDCNGATVGSILGAQLGLSKLPKRKWFDPLHDRIDLGVASCPTTKISAIVQKTCVVWQKLRSPKKDP